MGEGGGSLEALANVEGCEGRCQTHTRTNTHAYRVKKGKEVYTGGEERSRANACVASNYRQGSESVVACARACACVRVGSCVCMGRTRDAADEVRNNKDCRVVLM